MASILHYFLLLSSLLFIIPSSSSSAAKTQFRPKALLLRVTKDPLTDQYVTSIKQRTPFVPVKLTIDLSSPFLWVNCDKYTSSSFKPALCKSKICSLAKSDSCSNCTSGKPIPGCFFNSCYKPIENTFSSGSARGYGEIGKDILSLESTNLINPGKSVLVPDFAFSCGFTSLLDGLANGVEGIAGFGINNISIPSQLSSSLGLTENFAMCLSPSSQSPGFIILGGGDGPYNVIGPDYANYHLHNLFYTPLIMNPVRNPIHPGESSFEYFIGVKSIVVGDKALKINKKLLSINGKGRGGTKISTIKPYMVLESSIYRAVTEAFLKEIYTFDNEKARVEAVKPFGVCFNIKYLRWQRPGGYPKVPTIDLVLPNEYNNGTVYWRILGSNTMVKVHKKETMCLAVVDGGSQAETAIVIGGLQLEDMLSVFDIGGKRFGISGADRSVDMACSNFNFTSTP